jgi:acetyl-CoA C-acetyltransferase
MARPLPPNTPVIVAASQCVERLEDHAKPPFSSPIDLAAQASYHALADAGLNAGILDTIAVIRTFADTGGGWQAPFGRSSNPPASIARRLNAEPAHRIYSTAGGTEPVQLMMEMCREIARGAKRAVLLTGAEAIGSERFGQRKGLEDDWQEIIDAPLDNRNHKMRFVSRQELRSGLYLPAHFYALIENRQADDHNHTLVEHQRFMAQTLAPFSAIAARNPFSQYPRAYTEEELALPTTRNYPISLPYTKWLIAQDAVNQGAALVLTSVGYARELGIDPARWVYIRAHAYGTDIPLSQRRDPATSQVMTAVLQQTLQRGECTVDDLDMLDIYSCFPCAVHAACDALSLPTDGSRPLTVTGGLPYFGGPGNNYTMHALAEIAIRLQYQDAAQTAMVTANGGMLSKHAAVLLTNGTDAAAKMDWREPGAALDAATSDGLPYAAGPERGEVLSYTVIVGRNAPDTAIVLGRTAEGERFLAKSQDEATCAALRLHNPIGRSVTLTTEDATHTFTLDAH